MIDIFTKATSPLLIGLIIALGTSLFVNRSLSSDLANERAEKGKALVTISMLEQRIITISEIRKSDNKAAKDIFDHMERYNEVNANTAINIANAPSIQRQTVPTSSALATAINSTSTQSKQTEQESRKGHGTEEAKSNRQTKRPLSCSRKGQACNIDVPLPSLSGPLVLLYKNLSNATGGTSALAYGNKTSARSANYGDERPTVGTVGKGTSSHSR